MPNPFSTKNANLLLKESADLRKALFDALQIPNQQKDEVEKALDRVAA